MNAPSDAGTKRRLLEAAAAVFAQHGLEQARVRDICARAHANLAAVNYHFGSKERLYAQVLHEHLGAVQQRFPLDAGLHPHSSPEDRLRAFTRGLLHRLLGNGVEQNDKLSKLFMMELVKPSAHFGQLFESHIRPMHEDLKAILRQLLPGAAEEIVSRCAVSYLGVFALFDFSRELISRLGPELALEEQCLEHVADFIVEFTLGGVQRLRSAA
jgi:TetR/AcrR family transcriptional regulator, regulator of cefoperazone and chloramphenicol sensitivity